MITEDDAAQLYNDLEFYLISSTERGVQCPQKKWCREQCARGERELGIEVDI